MEELAQVYARSLFQVAQEQGKIDLIKEQLDQFAKVLNENRDFAIFFFSPYFSTEEKKENLTKSVEGADPAFLNFLEALIENHRFPALDRIRERYQYMWEEENKLLSVQVTTAVELDPQTVEKLGSQIGESTGRKVDVSATVDDEIVGGIVLRVGNSILDASIKTRLEKFKQQVAQAA